MRRILARAAVAAATLAFGGFAQAVPIYFDFTGTVTGSSPGATTVSGGFTFESDRLLLLNTGIPNQYDFMDLQPTGLTEPLAFIDFGGIHREIPSLALNAAGVTFSDVCRPACDPGAVENVQLSALTIDPFIEGFTGQRRRADLFLYNTYWNRLPEFPYYEMYDGFDGATADPLDLVTMTLADLSGTYYESVYDCVDGECTQTFEGSPFVQFTIDTVTRGVGPRSVPEPGPLGLLGAALAGVFLLRRRPTSGSTR